MIDGGVLQSAQKCFEKKSRVVVKMVVSLKFSINQNNVEFCGLDDKLEKNP